MPPIPNDLHRLHTHIRTQRHLSGLRRIHEQLTELSRSLLRQPYSTEDVLQWLNLMHDTLIRQTLHIVEQEWQEEKSSLPFFSYCWLILGSGGRQEQTLWTDQDNGIVYDTPLHADKEEVLAFVQQLAGQSVHALSEVGYPLCSGNVMATNPRWCKTTAEWQSMWQQWANEPSVENLRFFLISSDFRGIHGNSAMARQLRHWLGLFLSQQPRFLLRLAQHALVHPIPLNVLGQLLPERQGEHAGMLNVKEGVYVQLVNCVRLWALRYGIPQVNTGERLRALEKRGIWSSEEVSLWLETYYQLTRLRLQLHVTQSEQGMPPTNYVALKDLSKPERHVLKNSMNMVKRQRVRTERRFQQLSPTPYQGKWNGESTGDEQR